MYVLWMLVVLVCVSNTPLVRRGEAAAPDVIFRSMQCAMSWGSLKQRHRYARIDGRGLGFDILQVIWSPRTAAGLREGAPFPGLRPETRGALRASAHWRCVAPQLYR